MIRSLSRVVFSTLHRNSKHVVVLRRSQWNVAEEITDAVPEAYKSPFSLIENDLQKIPIAIGEELTVGDKKLEFASQYHFNQLGKLFRPTLVLLMSHCVNAQLRMPSRMQQENLFSRQFRVAMIAEMIHTASLIHDDILDHSPVRRNKPTLHCSVGTKTAVLTGDFILSRASRLIARLNNCAVTEILALILEDLVVGELMQANFGEVNEDSPKTSSSFSFDLSTIKPYVRPYFGNYLQRIYFKTASLMANSCKAVGVVSDCNAEMVKATYEVGRLVGMAFQIMDDLLDVTSQMNADTLGKPAGADLSLGLATAPILFASMEHPKLVELIQRRFSGKGDVEIALKSIHQSDAINQTRRLAAQYASQAVHLLNTSFVDSTYRTALKTLANFVIERNK